MSQWSFVLIAYGLVVAATVGLVLWSFWTMRRAETQAEAVKRRP